MKHENLYASPEPVEEFAADEKWQRNAKSLRVTTVGLLVASAGMLPLLLCIVWCLAFCGLHIIDSIMPWLTEAAGSLFFLGMGLFVVGVLMCLACGREVVRHGRWLILGMVGTLTLAVVSPGFIHGLSDRELTFLILVAFVLWCIFLQLLGTAMNVRYISVCVRVVFIALGISTIFASRILGDWPGFPTSYFGHPSGFWAALAMGVACVACLGVMLMLSAAIMRNLRMVQKMKNSTERKKYVGK